MKIVDFYEVSKSSVKIPYCDSHFDLDHIDQSNFVMNVNGQDLYADNSFFSRESIPVYRLCKNNGLNVNESFVSIDQELMQTIEMIQASDDYINSFDKLKEKYNSEIRSNLRLREALSKLENKQRKFSNAPWYKRVWLAIKNVGEL